MQNSVETSAERIRARTVITSEIVGLSALFEPDVGLVVYRREPSPAQALAIQTLLTSPFKLCREVVNADEPCPRALLLKLEGVSELADDLCNLGRVLCDLVGAERFGVRVARSDAPMCPAFHVDRGLARIVITYSGRGTEWLDEWQSPEASLRALAPFHVALCKGSAFPGPAAAVRHRSPPMSAGETRIVATLDPLE